MKTIVVLFDDLRRAERAVRALLDEAVPVELISLVAASESEEDEPLLGDGSSYVSGIFRARSGAAASLAQLLPDLAVVTIPGVGNVLASGPLVMASPHEATPIVHGGLQGDLVTAGVPEADAASYVAAIRAGSALVMVNTAKHRVERIADVLAACEPIEPAAHS